MVFRKNSSLLKKVFILEFFSKPYLFTDFNINWVYMETAHRQFDS